MELKDKVVVITGGSKGFGKALAEAFVAEGSKVVICAHHKGVEKVAEDLGIFGLKADVRQEDDMTTLAQLAINKFGRIDIWVNNAGIWTTNGPAEDEDMNKVKKMLEVNVLGLINGSRVALEHLKKQNSGIILNIISGAGLAPRPGIAAYAASKWAGTGYTKSIREENKNILVLGVYPGGMKTTIFGDYKYADFDKFMDPKEVAQKVINNLKKEKPELDLVIRRNE